MHEEFIKCFTRDAQEELKKTISFDDTEDHTYAHRNQLHPEFKIFMYDITDYLNLYSELYEIQKYIYFEWSKHKKNKTPNFCLLVCFFVSDTPGFDIPINTLCRLLCKLPGNKTEQEIYQIVNQTIKDLKCNEKVPIEAVGEKYYIPFVCNESINPLARTYAPPLYSILEN